ELTNQQQTSGGALIAFEVKGGVEAGIRLMNSVRLCALAENLGAAETIITHPASMTHADVPQEQRAASGITDGLVRLSVGLEDPGDIIRDLDQALACAQRLKEVSAYA
ncbi:MAG: cystathionine gamma-synthase, partial [Blastocatellia bacterium]